MYTTTTATIVGIALLVFQTEFAKAQSFNCRYAKTPVEVAICKDSNLSRLDEVMASINGEISTEVKGWANSRYIHQVDCPN